MNERVKFVAATLGADETFVELCQRFGISRKQGYKWKNSTSAEGLKRW
jgi:transposase-like protein